MGFRLFLIVLVSTLTAACREPSTPATTTPCSDPAQGCRVDSGGTFVGVRFSEPPRALRPFVLEVDAPDLTSVKADFSMAAMDMVPNRYDLLRSEDGKWWARVVLPLCVSGRQDWILTLALDDRNAVVPFTAAR